MLYLSIGKVFCTIFYLSEKFLIFFVILIVQLKYVFNVYVPIIYRFVRKLFQINSVDLILQILAVIATVMQTYNCLNTNNKHWDFTFTAVLVFKLLSPKVLFINKKDNRNCSNVGYFLRKELFHRSITAKL